jgi:hypothetical protein
MASPAPPRSRTARRPRSGVSAMAAAASPRPDAVPRPADCSGLTGRYRLDPRTTAWWWSPEMYELLGLPPEGTHPCTEVLLQCQHREDRGRLLAAIDRAITGRPFGLETRVLRSDGTLRVMVLLGEPRPGADGSVSAVEGICADITAGRLAHDDVVTALQTEVSQLRTAMASRATIEQAKGILMLLTNCSDQVAFELLTHMSSHTHRKVRDVAQSITESAAGHAALPVDIRAILRDACPPAPRLS